MCHKSEHLTRIRQTYINLHHVKHQNLRETTQRIRRVPECRARGSRVPSTRCRLECRPGRCGSRCTLSFLLRNTKGIDEMKMDKRNKRDMRLSRRLSFATNVVSLRMISRLYIYCDGENRKEFNRGYVRVHVVNHHWPDSTTLNLNRAFAFWMVIL
jgi:hypothetical protein